MRNDVQRPPGAVPRGGKGNGFFSLRNFSSYLRIVSSGASTVASTVRSAGVSVASSIAGDDDASRDQVKWAGFDKLESEGGVFRQVLLLGYRSGFQVWDVEEADDVRQLVSRHDGAVSFLQMQKKPILSQRSEDKFSDVRPLLAVVGDGSFSGSCNGTDASGLACNGSAGSCHDLGNENLGPTFVRFYSLRCHEYVHALKFRSVVYSIRCSPRMIAVAQAAQIHCFDAATLEREYTILTYPIVSGSLGCARMGYGPLAVGSRWLAYSGKPVSVTNTDRVTPQHLPPGTGLPATVPNGSIVAHYAKESSKQLAAGIVTLGDMGYKKLSKYCSDLLPDGSYSPKQGYSTSRNNGIVNGHFPDEENVGMVIVRDIVSKSVIVQFRAHRSPISALCFDPTGTLLVTASIHGHNINVFRIMAASRTSSLGSDAAGTCIHLYRLQRGITNAVIQDISFSNDSEWIMISSSRGTSHLFAISPFGGTVNHHFNDARHTNNNHVSDLTSKAAVCGSNGRYLPEVNQENLHASGCPVTLSVVSRIKNGSNSWKGAVTGAAAAATGRVSPLSGAIASAFHNCKTRVHYSDINSLKAKYHLLVFSPSGSIIQYVLRESTGEDNGLDLSGISTVSHVAVQESDSRFVVEALQKWDVCHRRTRRDREDNFDVYGEHGTGESNRLCHKGSRKGTSIYPADSTMDRKPRVGAEENHHLYISEAELQMHASHIPLWAKSEISFQVMLDENSTKKYCGDLGGEIEIERIPIRVIEARSKELIPVVDYYQTPQFPKSRSHSFNKERTGPLPRQMSGFFEDERHSRRSSCSSLDGVAESAAIVEHFNGFCDNSVGSPHAPAEANEDLVHSLDKQKIGSALEFVNTSEGLNMEAQLEHVNNTESLKMEPLLERYGEDVG